MVPLPEFRPAWDAEFMGRTPTRTGTMLALLCGFALRAWFVAHHPRFVGDTAVYGDLAQNLLRHGIYGLTEEHIRPTLIRLPGYPFFLAVCFRVFGMGNLIPVLWVQVFVDLLGCWLLGSLARRLFGTRVGLAAVWLGALCPFTANYTAAALTETLSIFCVTLALWALALWRERGGAGWALLIGAAITFAAVLRPDGGLLAAAVVPAMLWVGWRGSRLSGVPNEGREREANGYGGAVPKEGRSTQAPFRKDNNGGKRGCGALRDAMLASALLCAALGAWAVRNWRVFHVLQPLAPKYANDPGEPAPLGFARWYRTWGLGFGDTVRVYWAWDGSAEQMSDLPERAFDGWGEQAETAALFARYNVETSSTPEFEGALAALAARRIGEHPVRYYALLPAARMLDMWLRPRTELMKLPLDWLRFRVHPRRSLFEIAYGGLDWLLLGLGLLGAWRVRRSWSVVTGAGVTFVVLRSLMLMTIDNSEPRYTLECFPVVLLLTAAALSSARAGLGLKSSARKIPGSPHSGFASGRDDG